MVAFRTIEDLPTELILEILESVTDIETLDCLVRASPNTFRVFDIHGLSSFDRILSSSPIHRHSQEVIRTIAHIRSGQFPITTSCELQRRVTSAACLEDCDRTEADFFPTTFPSIASNIIWSILATARRILRFTVDLIQRHLDRFQRLRPKVAPRPFNQSQWHDLFTVKEVLDLCPDEIIDFEVHDIGAPTWTEEQTVLIGFWRMQLVDDLRLAVNTGTVTGWSSEQKLKLNDFQLEDIYDFQEMAEVASLQYASAGNYSASDLVELNDWSTILTIKEHLGTSPPKVCTNDRSWKRPWPCPTPSGDQYEDHQLRRQKLNWRLEIFERLFWEDQVEYHKILTFGPYRRLGFDIWSRERLRGYGFLDDGKAALMPWISVLDFQSLAVLKHAPQQTVEDATIETMPRERRITKNGRFIEHLNPVSNYHSEILYHEHHITD